MFILCWLFTEQLEGTSQPKTDEEVEAEENINEGKEDTDVVSAENNINKLWSLYVNFRSTSYALFLKLTL